jgi:Tol biopolymer transport system component
MIIDAPIGLNYPDWSPDGESFAALGYVSESTWSIYVFDVDGENLERLTTTNDVWDGDPSWSPDGSQIVFTRIYPAQNYRAEIWVMNANGGNQRWLGIEGGAAKWSPDGTRLVYHSMKNDSYDIYTCSIDGTDEQQLTSTTPGELTPAWSPDGSQIVTTVVTDVGDGFVHQVYVMNSDGTNARALTDEEAGGATPRWSPDGSLIAFKSGGEVQIINADGTNIRRVTNSPTDVKAINPVWKPLPLR